MATKLSDIDFSTTTSLSIPEGDVIKIAKNGTVVWEKPVDVTYVAVGSLPVGSIIELDVNSTAKNFIVVHQGNPDSTIYDSSCNGTWLLMEDIYEKRVWDSSDNDYENSDIHTYLNDTFVNLFTSGIQNAIKQVKLPYTKGTGKSGTLTTGSNGLSAKVFLLSHTEVGFSGRSNVYVEGAVLDYFNGAADSKRIAYFNSSAAFWNLRSPGIGDTKFAFSVDPDGNDYIGDGYVTGSSGVRPALVLDSSFLIPDPALSTT